MDASRDKLEKSDVELLTREGYADLLRPDGKTQGLCGHEVKDRDG